MPRSEGSTPGPVRIEISGPRGSGKTITAARVILLLRSLGFQVEYRGCSKFEEQDMAKLLAQRGPIVTSNHQRFIVEDRCVCDSDCEFRVS